ncbi:MAG: LysM peptidoglycan-binding domain-containing protein [Planctomycetes bacterium]|nr:LysM peptidoglycan-binding domain-containing protein [Planctomycetota bacterium]
MNANTKIGVLVGLLAIFVLAFALRGLSSSTQRFATHEIQDHRSLKPSARRIADLPLSINPRPTSPSRQTSRESRQADTNPAKIASSRPDPSARQGPAGGRPAEALSPQTVTYTVRPGDNLALIAKRLYGLTQGNRMRVVKALFSANRHSLKTADELRIGQTLVIPRLPQAASGSDFAGSTGQGRDLGKIRTGRAIAPPYAVRDGDSLWKIAAAKLGDGRRYLDILRLNRDLLEDADDLRPGILLRLPGR